jgi:hypothetical protein
LEKKEPTLLVPIGGDCMAAESIGRERRAASEAERYPEAAAHAMAAAAARLGFGCGG